jgi:hypothetical protein
MSGDRVDVLQAFDDLRDGETRIALKDLPRITK